MREETAVQAATRFLQAFDNLEWKPFCAAIAPDATMFMPFAHVVKRLDGRPQIEAAFKPFFTQVRQQQSGPPYLRLEPLDMIEQQIGNVAFFTFHLDDGSIWCRRTLIFERREGCWLLVHLHASNMPLQNS